MKLNLINCLTSIYIFALVIQCTITNVKPYVVEKSDFVFDNVSSNSFENLGQVMVIGIVINQVLIMLIGFVGNMLTLAAIPYVRSKYGSEFSILKLNSVVLILHLSFCDLLYNLIGFPHLIKANLFRPDETLSRFNHPDLCYFLGLIRNLIAYADFNSIAIIACCVARQTLCRTCKGDSFKHDEHDILFGGKKIYLACAASWIIAFFTLLPDIVGKIGSYGWTGSVYGCDSVNSTAECSNIGPLLNQIINLCAVIGFYTAIMWHLFELRKEVYGSEKANYDEILKSISLTLILLTAAYVAFLMPISIFATCSPASAYLRGPKPRAMIASWYWWLYGINFLIYLTTNPRMRAAYKRFLKDALKTMLCRNQDKKNNKEEFSSFPFWIGLRSMQNERNEHNVT